MVGVTAVTVNLYAHIRVHFKQKNVNRLHIVTVINSGLLVIFSSVRTSFPQEIVFQSENDKSSIL